MPSIEQTVVITGASGRIGRTVVPLLRRPGRMLRLVDTSPIDFEAGDDLSWHDVSIEDAGGMEAVLHGASGLVHLAGLSEFIGKPISLSAESAMNPEQYDIVLM